MSFSLQEKHHYQKTSGLQESPQWSWLSLSEGSSSYSQSSPSQYSSRQCLDQEEGTSQSPDSSTQAAAFIGSWFEFLSISWSFGIITVAVFEGIWYIFGPIVGISSAGVNDVVLFGAGVGLLILFTVIGALGVRMTGYLLQAMFWIPAVLTIYVIYLLGSSVANPAALTAGMAAISSQTPQGIVSLALKQGMDTVSVSNYWSAVAVAMGGAYFAYIGYAASTFVAGEVKEANKSLPKVLILSSLVIMTMYVIVSSFGAYATAAVGRITLANGHTWSLFEAYAWLSYGAGTMPAGLPKAWTTTIAAFTGTGMGLNSLNWLLFIFGILWVANDIPPFILTASRVLFAMAFDRVLPASMASVNERFHSPVNATIMTGIFGLLGCFSESGIVSAGWQLEPRWMARIRIGLDLLGRSSKH